MTFQVSLWLAQIDSATGTKQTEYPLAFGLIAAMVLLGLLAVCIPRFRKKHFIEPNEVDAKKNRMRR